MNFEKGTHDVSLAPNFLLSEFVRNGDPLPSELIVNNLRMLANRLQVIRDIYSAPITVTSGWRTIEHNQEVGGALNSQHLYGKAADITMSNFPPRRIQKALHNWSGGLGKYETFTHVDIRDHEAIWNG